MDKMIDKIEERIMEMKSLVKTGLTGRFGMLLGASLIAWCGATGTAQANQPPVPNAGVNQNMSVDQTIALHGSAADPDGDAIVGWAWIIESAPPASNATLSYDTSQNPLFSAHTPGDYVVTLYAIDGISGGGIPGRITIHVAP